jgi:nicotinamide-nucleotide amidase
MKAEIISTGEEIRTGAVTDTNSAYIARRLEACGSEVVRHSCVGDDMPALVEILRETGRRADIAVVTGGLGPTPDDITAEAAAGAGDTDLVLDPAALAGVRAFCEKRRLPLTESNRKQALLPRGARVLENQTGSAPGFEQGIGKCRFFFLPGVPAEMRAMLEQTVLVRIASFSGTAAGFRRAIEVTTFGLTESATADALDGFRAAFPQLKLGLRVKFPEIRVRLYGRGADPDGLQQRLDEAVAWIRERLGNTVLAADGRPMEAVVGDMLRDAGATIAVAESCTGGLISHMLTDVSGSSDYFLLGGVTYANEAKIKLLGVSEETLARCGAVHEETARQMADGIRKFSRAGYGLSTTGIAGPTGGSRDKPVGTVCIGLAGPQRSFGKRYRFYFEERSMNKRIFAVTALNVLRKALAATG